MAARLFLSVALRGGISLQCAFSISQTETVLGRGSSAHIPEHKIFNDVGENDLADHFLNYLSKELTRGVHASTGNYHAYLPI